MKIKEKMVGDVGLALGLLTHPFWIISFVGLTLILGKITGGKTDTALHYRSVKREGINVRFGKLPC